MVAVGAGRRFVSVAAAARWVGVCRSRVRRAAQDGTRAGGYWWRYADMPAKCQPLCAPKSVPLICVETRQPFNGFAEVIRGVVGHMRSRSKPYHRELTRLRRAFLAGQPYCGFTYHERIGDE